MDLEELFGKPPEKSRQAVRLAMVIQLLQEILDEVPEESATLESEEENEVLTRPHFMPSGG